jgi:uncharacterized protein
MRKGIDMIIDLSEFMSVKGQVKNIQAPFELKSIAFNNMEHKVVNGKPINFFLAHTGERKVEIDGKTNVTLLISCNRCLSDVEVDFDIHFQEELNFSTRNQDEINELKEANYLNEYDLDLDLLVQDEIILDFPMKVLCNEDCKGLCSNCGTNLNKGSCNCDKTSLDPRMAAIQDIFNEFKEV